MKESPKGATPHNVPLSRPRHLASTKQRKPRLPTSPQQATVPRQPPVEEAQTQLLNPTKRDPFVLPKATAACTVPGCTIPSCQLRSHREYASLVLLQREQKLRSRQKASRDVDLSGATDRPRLLPPAPGIGRDGIDGFPHMPIQDQLEPENRDLFHHFFANVFDRLVLIFRAPPIAKDFKPRMLQVALSTPSYCMALIAQSRIDTDISRDQYNEDRKSLALYGKVLEVYRQHFKVMQPAHVDILLLVVVILLTYDMIHGRRQSAQIHWNGMQQLVGFRGGIHNIGVSLAYVVHADRVVATFNDKPPAYPLPADRSIQLTRPPKCIYGSAFVASPSLVDAGILTQRSLDYCIDTVRLVELFEATQMCFDPKISSHAKISNIEYFYFSRDRLDGQFPIIKSELHKHKTYEYCIILAARLSEYPITWANYIPTLTMLLAEQLQKILAPDDMLSIWSVNLNLLSWSLLVAAIAPTSRETHAWFVKAFGRVVAKKYGLKGYPDDMQPEVWRDIEWNSARTFIWSDTHMRDGFDKVCDAVEAAWTSDVIIKTDVVAPRSVSPDLW
jgi:hypothetical protein